MTEAQKLVEEFRTITAPGRLDNTWTWAKRVTANLEAIGPETIGSRQGNLTYRIQTFRCADGSRFAYDMNGACQTWAMPA